MRIPNFLIFQMAELPLRPCLGTSGRSQKFGTHDYRKRQVDRTGTFVFSFTALSAFIWVQWSSLETNFVPPTGHIFRGWEEGLKPGLLPASTVQDILGPLVVIQSHLSMTCDAAKVHI